MSMKDRRDKAVPALRAVESLLRSLVGVAAVKLAATPTGQITQLVVTPDGTANERQVVRNVHSALRARFGLDIPVSAITIGPSKTAASADTSNIATEAHGTPTPLSEKAGVSPARNRGPARHATGNGALNGRPNGASHDGLTPPATTRSTRNGMNAPAPDGNGLHALPARMAGMNGAYWRNVSTGQRPANGNTGIAASTTSGNGAHGNTAHGSATSGNSAHSTGSHGNGSHGSGTHGHSSHHAAPASLAHPVSLDMPAAQPTRRAVFQSAEFERSGASQRCRVVITAGAQQFIGVANSAERPVPATELVALATLDAFRAANGNADLALDGLSLADVAGRAHVLVSFTLTNGNGPEKLAGAEPITSSATEAVARAVISSMNAHLCP